MRLITFGCARRKEEVIVPMLITRLRHLILQVRGKPLLPPGIRIGRGVHIGKGVQFDWSHGRHITIEDDVTLVAGVRILCHDASSYRRLGVTRVAAVHIGRRAFVGAWAMVMPGVSVGSDAVIGAGSVVTHDVAAGTVVAGVPAVPLGLTSDLDEARLRRVASGRLFDESVYHVPSLSPDRSAELDRASVKGEYWMARPDVARRFLRP